MFSNVLISAKCSPTTIRCSVENIVHHSSLPHAAQRLALLKGIFFCPNGSAVIDLVMYGKDGTKICIQVSEVAYPDHASASKTSDNPGKIHALIQ